MHGMTANTFTSLSLDPPLVLFCVGQEARMAGLLEHANSFAVNILSADQAHVCQQFAGQLPPDDKQVENLQRGPVAPLVPGAIVSISCALETMHSGGDHLIVVGRVLEIHEPEHQATRPPLLFFRSGYAHLNEIPSAEPVQELFTNDAIRIYHDEWSVDLTEVVDETTYVRISNWE